MINEEKDAFYHQIGKKIAFIRKSRNINQQDLADKINLSRASIVNIEKGRQMPSVYILWKIADILNIKLGKLIPITSPGEILSSDILIKEISKESDLSHKGKNDLTNFLNDL